MTLAIVDDKSWKSTPAPLHATQKAVDTKKERGLAPLCERSGSDLKQRPETVA
jgi:hypothetical protein